MLILIFNILRFYFQRLEQEKHILRRKLSEAESEGDIRAQDLESDYNDLKAKLLAQVSKKLKKDENIKNTLLSTGNINSTK